MYEAFFNLSNDPFRLLPDPGICFPHRSCARAWAYLRYAVKRGEGIVVVTGRPGSGKTTLAQRLLNELNPSKTVSVQLIAHDLSATDLLRKLAYAFGVPAEGMDRAMLAHRIEQYLIELEQSKRRALVVIDEAQTLSHHALEAMRLLTDLQSHSRPVLQLILLGQNELEDVMSAPGMEQFQHRVIASCRLQTMDLKETKSYLEYRLAAADWRGDPSIDGSAVMAIYQNSGGLPRHVNKICSRLFLHASSEEIHALSADDVQAVVSDLKEELLAPLNRGGAVESEPTDMPDSLDDLALAPSAEPTAPHPYACLSEGNSQRTLSGLYPADDPSGYPYAPAAVDATSAGGELDQPYRAAVPGGQADYPYQSAPLNADGGSPYQPEAPTDTGWAPDTRHQAARALGVAREKARQLLERLAQWTPRARGRLGGGSASRLHKLRGIASSIRSGSGAASFKALLATPPRAGMRQALLAGLAILAVVAVVAIVVQGPDDPVGPADDSDGLVAQPHAPQGTAATVAEPSLAAPEGLVEYPDPVAPELAAGPALPEPPTADPAKEQRAPAIPTVPTIAATALADELDTDWADPAGQGVLEARTEGPAALDEPALRDPGPAAGDDAVALSASPGGVDAVGAPLQSAAPSPQQDEGPAANRAPDEPLKAVSAPVVPKPSEPLEVTASPEAVADSRQSDSRDAEAAVLAEVARLNALAAKALDRYRLLLPEEDNAYSYYRRVLALDPANSEAQQGLAQIVQKYGEMAESALGRNDLQKAELYVGRALSVDPGHSETLLLLDRIERAMADAEASRQAAAERAAAEREAARAAQREQGQSEETAEASPPSGLERLMRFVGGRGSDADR